MKSRRQEKVTMLVEQEAALAQAADNASVEKIEREFFNLFIGVGHGELLPYGSYYLTGFLNERPLARLREDLRALGIERAEGQVEPEDHAAILCEIMARLANGQFAAATGVQQQFFEKHLAPWIGRFFADLERADSANFYRHAGTVGRLFMEIETEAFALSVCVGRFGGLGDERRARRHSAVVNSFVSRHHRSQRTTPHEIREHPPTG
jgi:TorA maturation chaperone TorD